jgi:protein TonB
VPDEPVVQPTTDSVAFTTGPDTGTPSPDPGTLTTGAGVDTEPVVEAPKVFEFVEKMPEYEGGYEAMMKFLQRKTRYPAIAIRKKDEGTVYVSFVVSPDGSVTHVQIVKGISKECDAEAMRVISLMDKWKAGIQNGMPVSVKKVLPITFRLEH